MLQNENYERYLIAGVVLTLLILVGFAYYFVQESNRLEAAAATFKEERIDHGREIYADQCAACHGPQGEGGSGTALNNKTLLKNTFDEVLFSVIRSGVPSTQMPAWSVDFGGPLTDEDIRSVVAFIRAWEPTAPVIEPEVFVPSAERGALVFATTCAVCHGEDGRGSDFAPAVNDPARLSERDIEWYRSVIAYGRPAKGMPTWRAVLSSDQMEDLLALMSSWREGQDVAAAFSVTDLLELAVYALQSDDPESALLHIQRALRISDGMAAEVLNTAESQLTSGDSTAALETLESLKEQWPVGDPDLGAETYAAFCKPCHGAQGEGGAGGAFPGLNPSDFVQANSNAALVEFLAEGRAGTAMTGFAGRLTEDEMANLVAFLRLWQP